MVGARDRASHGTLRPTLQCRASRVRLGIARDEAFHFYYPDNLETLQSGGAELAAFSPLADGALPEDLDGLYFGGGYPEIHATRLAANRPMLDAVRRFSASGRPVYAECGGLMYLGVALRTLDGARHAMAGVVPVETAMLKTLKTLGYTEATFTGDWLWGAAGDACRGHEFHYSEIVADRGRGGGLAAGLSLASSPRGGRRLRGLRQGPRAGQLCPPALGVAAAGGRRFLARCEERG